MSSTDLLVQHLNQASLTPDADTSFYAEDAIAEFKYAPEDHTRNLTGRDAIVAFMRRIPTFAEAFVFHEPRIHELSDGFVAEYRGESTFKSTGNRYVQDYIVVFKVKDGQIQSYTEYYDPMRVLRAMGEID